jgi:cobalt/nickel transport system permease protein
MRLPHAHALYVHGKTAIHRAPAVAKLAGLVVFVVAVASTPGHEGTLLAAEATAIAVMAAVAHLRPRVVVSRLAIEAPFLAFVALLPFVGGGDRVDVLGVGLSVEGAWAAWGILAKATLCLVASIVVTATTTVPDLLAGLARLRVPPVMVSIAGFMVRYIDLLVAEWRRMRFAMAARGYAPRSVGNAVPLANGAAGLFVRSHERGERVYAAMLARGHREAAR